MTRVYFASKTRHADKWLDMIKYLNNVGIEVCSTWIHEAGEGQTRDFGDLWHRCIRESSECDFLILYYQEDDKPLKGALIEAGSALSHGRPVLFVGPRDGGYLGNVLRNPRIRQFDTMDDAIKYVLAGP